MSIKVDMTSTDLDKQLAVLEYYSEIMDKYFRPALNMGVKSLKEAIRPNIPVGRGRALAAFRSTIRGKGINLEGRVGWKGGKGAPWWINIVESGAAPHKIVSRNKGGFLWFGNHAYRSIEHPGFPARGFMAAGYAMVQPLMDPRMVQASEQVINELAVK